MSRPGWENNASLGPDVLRQDVAVESRKQRRAEFSSRARCEAVDIKGEEKEIRGGCLVKMGE